MSRFLFVVPPLTGHVNPTASVGGELLARGHDVAWVGHPGTLAPLLPDGALVFPAIDDRLEAEIRAKRQRWLALRGMAVLKFFWEEFLIPLGHAMVPGTRFAVRGFQPDVVVADQQALAGPLVAKNAGLPWVTSASTSAELVNPLRTMPRVDAWVRGLLHGFAGGDIRFSDRLVLVYSSKALVTEEVGDEVAFVGPALTHRVERVGFPWERLTGGRRVLVSLGTLNGPAGERFLGQVLDAVADLDLQVVMVAPPRPAPPNVLVRPAVPQLALMPHLDAVVTHGGHNTVCEALAHGLPLVVAPIRDDQPTVAAQVVAAGAGVRLTYSRARAAEVRSALESVLDEPEYAAAAELVRESFSAAGGAGAAADLLEKVVAG
ncbi:glycosyltransferase, MGT family [Lentzea xinjiangensis]|uniref:Glycosyltransferase, MGT family n=1 Tax=Lentzea xinjiangensis TaxID=402600 RepID=A0A1H9V6R0_9PSEU|nr:nucleotide disphospho-sugar-binding domain-containing protein [Lentzea xinjiangensis]SES17084.1 glycosyltransferase, MGT family [Lentzea xinjiangensis]